MDYFDTIETSWLAVRVMLNLKGLTIISTSQQVPPSPHELTAVETEGS